MQPHCLTSEVGEHGRDVWTCAVSWSWSRTVVVKQLLLRLTIIQTLAQSDLERWQTSVWSYEWTTAAAACAAGLSLTTNTHTSITETHKDKRRHRHYRNTQRQGCNQKFISGGLFSPVPSIPFAPFLLPSFHSPFPSTCLKIAPQIQLHDLASAFSSPNRESKVCSHQTRQWAPNTTKMLLWPHFWCN